LSPHNVSPGFVHFLTHFPFSHFSPCSHFLSHVPQLFS
jgi:hypothetical protein